MWIVGICSLNFSNGTSVLLYADDLLLIKAIPDVNSELIFQQDLDLVYHAYKDLLLNLNGSKSKFLIVSVSPRPATISVVPSLDGVPLIQVPELKYLGVLLDRKFSFDAHNSQVALHAKHCIGVLFASVGKWAGPVVFSYLYKTTILPILMYSLPLAAPRFNKDWHSLEKVHHYALRLITNNYCVSYVELLRQTKFVSIIQLYFQRGICLMYKCNSGTRRLASLFQRFVPSSQCSLRSRFAHSFPVTIPTFRSVACECMPLYRLFSLWNAISLDGFDLDAIISGSFPIFKTFSRRHDLFVSVQSRKPTILPSPLHV